MFLKALELKGFKSFADSTTLLLEPGLTVVVGPNGSGKSNVVDAIGWVLGAQAPSVVRSKTMDDVIFAGTTTRPALGRAEVSLTIDNSSGDLPIEFTEVTVSRTLFRSGDSEYSMNGVPCRLLDIQELLSDTGVGRQQHLIVSQGQIDAVLGARPEERRLIIEEAAGILKYRRRKEKAERRLAATDDNLTRLKDLLGEVKRQLRPLERQADAARRHGDVEAELHGLQVHLAGREIASLQTRATALEHERDDLEADEQDLRREVATLDDAVATGETELTRLGTSERSDDLVRFEALSERARGLAALLVERARRVDHERSAALDQSVALSLRSDANDVQQELAAVESELADLDPQRAELAESQAELERDRDSFEGQRAEADLDASRAAEARGEIAARQGGIERDEAERDRIDELLTSLGERQQRLGRDRQHRATQAGELREAIQVAASASEAAEAWRRETEGAAETAEQRRRGADADRHRWAARLEAIEAAAPIVAERAEALQGVTGVLGPLVASMEIDEGWEPAVRAALGEALGAVVVADTDAARRLAGAVDHAALVVADADRPRPATPSVGAPIRPHVHADPQIAPAVDRLLGAAVVVSDWEAAVDAAIEHPEAVVVTDAGGRLGGSVWHVGGELDLDDARTQAAAAEREAEEADRAHREALAAVSDARESETERGRTCDEQAARRAGATEAVARLDEDLSHVEAEVTTLAEHRDDLDSRLRRDRDRLVALHRDLPDLVAHDEGATDRGRALADHEGSLGERAAALAAAATDLRVRAASLADRRSFLERRHHELEARLADDPGPHEESGIGADAVAIERLGAFVADRREVIGGHRETLRRARAEQSEATRVAAAELDAARRDRARVDQQLAASAQRTQKLALDATEISVRLEAAIDALRRDHDCEADAAVRRECSELPAGVTAAARVRELERDRQRMGAINPLALEEFTELGDRHEFLQGQLDDVKATRRDLQKVIRQVDQEIVTVFASAFADVAANFEMLFDTLFPGGSGRLSLTEPDNLLETGVEISGRPLGKNVRKLSLLSGGERSLTSLAFLFAVFRARPSPFYVLDEVEAALDDVNLQRFCNLLGEFRDDAQLIVVSHQKRTMETADLLYGVSMREGGSSMVVTARVSEAVGISQ